jgi:DNA-binding winged helix-turn-helix (wHTH) protein
MREIYYFGPFALDVSQRRLSRGRRTIPLPPKTLDVLVTLVRRAERLVTKQELLEAVWRGVFVDEGILTVHVAAARKALGQTARAPYIDTVVGSGYRFARPVTRLAPGGDSPRRHSGEAADCVARGRALLLSGASVSLPAAVAQFARAIELNETHPAAHAGLALAHCAEARLYVSPHARALAAAKTSALRALAMDSESADALTALGVVLLVSEWDWSAAERSLRRALDLEPSHIEAQLHLGTLLAARGDLHEGLRLTQRALACQPGSPLILIQIAMTFWHLRQDGAAIEWAQRALQHEPRQLLASEFLAIVYWTRGEIDRLVAERLRRARALGLGEDIVSGMTLRAEALREALDRHGVAGVNRWLRDHFATGDDGRASVQRAVLCASSGEADAAFQHLDAALQARDPAMIDLAVSPLWDPLRADPRFANRLARVGLDPRITSTRAATE